MTVRADREKLQEEHAKKVRERKQHYHHVFNTDHGKKVLDDLVSFSGYNAVAYRPGCNLQDVAFLEGQRAIVKYILDMLEYEIKYDKKTDPQG